MKRVLLGLLLVFGVQVVAYAANDMYMQLVCRSNDPYVFCTQGCKEPDRAWVPVNHAIGLWRARIEENYCPYPSVSPCYIYPTWYRGWGQTAVTALGQYLAVCTDTVHHGGRKSDWVPRDGQGEPEDEPFSH